MQPLTVLLRDFADPGLPTLETAEQAQRLIDALASHRCRWIELNCAGVLGASQTFRDEFARLAEARLSDVWLMPRHCGRALQPLAVSLAARLKRQREQAWRESCETYLHPLRQVE